MPLNRLHPLDGRPITFEDDRYKEPPEKKSEKTWTGNAQELKVIFQNGSALTDGEKQTLKRKAHEELYWEMLNKYAPPKTTNAELRQQIEAARNQQLNIELVVICVDQHDREGSFSRNLKDLDKFLKTSRKAFIRDSIAELQQASAVGSEGGRKARFKLCIELVKAQKIDELKGTGFFDVEHIAAIDELRRSPEVGSLFNSVERILSKKKDEGRGEGRGGGERKFVYGEEANGRDRGRDRSRESFDRR